MNLLNVILIIGGITAAVGLLCFAHEKLTHKGHHHGGSRSENAETDSGEDAGKVATENKEEQECCGLHAVCEKIYGPEGSEKPLYYDDEELDVLAGRNPESFSEEEREQLRDVMMTLLPADRPGWWKSLEIRRIELPSDLKDELLLLLEES